MSDILLLQDRVKNTIQLGESHFREFKSALEGRPDNKKPRLIAHVCRDVAEALVAFSNADGGELLIGVEDDGTISGLQYSEVEIKQILDALTTHVHPQSHLPILTATKLNLEGKTVLFFSVAKGTTEIYQLIDGRCVRRKDKSTVPVAFKQIQFERQEVRSREYDRQFVDGASVQDLDMALIQSLANRYLSGLSVELYLQQTGLAEYAANGIRLRMAAVLLFAKDIQKWHPRSQVRILKINGTQLKSGEHYNVNADEIVSGNIFKLLIDSWERLRPFLAYKTEFGVDARFEQKYIYPESASREALINAVAHRDYSIQNGIEVYVFDDRMEIRSPGALLSTLTVENLEELQGAHESRNVLIAKVLRENEYVRELGEGMRRMFELMAESELDKPKLYSNSSWFSVTLSHRSLFNPQQEQFLKLYDALKLSPRQKRIIVLGMGGREISPNEIVSAMSTDDRNTYDREVTGLRKTQVLTEIRKNVQAKQYAKQKGIKKEDVPRFKVNMPETTPKVEYKSESSRLQRNPKFAVFLRNLPISANDEQLRKIFAKYGTIAEINLPTDRATGKLKGIGFIWYQTAEAAQKTLQDTNKIELDTHQIYVEEYKQR